jgi:Ca2+-binding EF-hand superfamily protein
MLKLMKKVDVDQDGELSYPEFLEAAKYESRSLNVCKWMKM